MTRAEALTIAQEHVEKMATNIRGYQDGVKFVDKVAAVEKLARYLLETDGESGGELAALADRVENLEDAASDFRERLSDLDGRCL